jgi:hypothetical protein
LRPRAYDATPNEVTFRPPIWIAAAALACSHAQPAATASASTPPARASAPAKPPPPPPRISPGEVQSLSDETRALLRDEGERLWTRWTTGAGPMPSAALADHRRLTTPEALDAVGRARERARKPADVLALRLLHAELSTLAIANLAAPQIEALEQARAKLAFAAPGDQHPDRGERDLDRLLTDEGDAKKRGGIAQAEARAVQPLAPLALARDEAVQKATDQVGLKGWAAVVEQLHNETPADLASLAERTLTATEQVARRAVALGAERNLGVPIDKLRRADLPRLTRSASADPQFPAGKAWETTRAALVGAGIDPGSLKGLRLDVEPSPSKGARPLALLVDPPGDVRLSIRPAGGFEEQRAVLHESARAVGGAFAEAPRWELAQLGDGAAAEGAAQLFEELAGNPDFLREHTGLRGEPLDDLVHTQAMRRLLAARRAAAMVLYEVKRREGPPTAESNAALYRSLVQRATFATLSEEDAGRWALEADGWLRIAEQLEGALLAAHLEEALRPKPLAGAVVPASTAAALPQPGQWWHATGSATLLRRVWSLGRSGTAADAATAIGLEQLDPAVLAVVAERQLAYAAPDAPPPTERPDYKYMQGDKKRRRKKKK